MSTARLLGRTLCRAWPCTASGLAHLASVAAGVPRTFLPGVACVCWVPGFVSRAFPRGLVPCFGEARPPVVARWESTHEPFRPSASESVLFWGCCSSDFHSFYKCFFLSGCCGSSHHAVGGLFHLTVMAHVQVPRAEKILCLEVIFYRGRFWVYSMFSKTSVTWMVGVPNYFFTLCLVINVLAFSLAAVASSLSFIFGRVTRAAADRAGFSPPSAGRSRPPVLISR